MESSQLGSQSWNWGTLNTADDENEEDDIALPILNNKNNTSNNIPASQLAPPSGQDTTTDHTAFKEEDGLEEEDDDDDDPWEKSTSEIASISSEELHETRPNRWKGNPKTWSRWTKPDRDAWASIEGVRMNDLGVHLYNAFALKRDARVEIEKAKAEAKKKDRGKVKGRGKGKGKGKVQMREEEEEEVRDESVAPRSGQKELAGEEDAEDTDMYSEGSAIEVEKPWTPPKSWTAWPNYERGYERLGNGELMAGIGERFEAETIKRNEDWIDKLPGRHLEEEISAGILRVAKERFYRRLARWKKQQEEEEAVGDGDEEEEEVIESVESEAPGQRPGSRSSSENQSPSWGLSEGSERGYTSGQESHGSRGRTPGESQPRKRKRSPSYEPTLMADDEVAYEMVRPATLQIMKQLDNTLTTLHNSRVASFRVKLQDDNVTDADTNTEGHDTDGEYTAAEQSPPQTPPRKTGRPRKAAPACYEKPRSGSRGRPRKIHIPLEGETEEEMRIRIARQQKRRMPDSYFDSSDRGNSRSRSRSRGVASRGRSNEAKNAGRRRRSVSRGSRASSVASPGTPLTELRRKRLRKLPLRDWRHVIGAAALAGFEPDVIARATERCASLFGQNITINTLQEVPAADPSKDWIETATYTPRGVVKGGGPQRLSSDKVEELRGTQRLSSDKTEDAQRSTSPPITTPSTPKENPRFVGGLHKCPLAGCPMAVKGFNKHWNLRRHVQKQHPGLPTPEMPSLAGSQAGSTMSLRSSMDAVSPGPEAGNEGVAEEAGEGGQQVVVEEEEVQTNEDQDKGDDDDDDENGGGSEVYDQDGNESEGDEDVAEVSDGDD